MPGLAQASAFAWQRDAHCLRIHLIEFEPASFHLAAFARAGIALPAAIERSVPRRQCEYFFGRLAASAALAEIGVENARVDTGSRREPIWPPGIVGSITHNARYAAASVAQAASWRGIGVDIEERIAEEALASVEQIGLSADERQRLHAPGHPPYALAVTLAFSAKESFYKAIFPTVGRFVDFDAIRIDAIDLEPGRIRFTTQETLCPDWPAGRSSAIAFRLLPGGEVMTCFSW